MNRTTKKWLNKRWELWLAYFLATITTIIILSLVLGYVDLQNQLDIERRRVDSVERELRTMRNMMDIVTGVEDIKQKEQ